VAGWTAEITATRVAVQVELEGGVRRGAVFSGDGWPT